MRAEAHAQEARPRAVRRQQDLSTQEIMVDYLDGRLDQAHREAFEERLAGDAQLLRELDELRTLRGLLGSD